MSAFSYSDTRPIEAAVEWITSAVLGSVAMTLCVLAVAYAGFLMVSGRLHIRQGLRVVLGCFILLGAPVIANAFLNFSQEGHQQSSQPPFAALEDDPRENLPPADYDPYAGASLRRD